MASKIIVDQLEKSGLTALTLPVANATANQYIKNDGAGALSWATLPSSGKVLQVIANTWKTISSTTSTTYSLVTDSGTIITPSATTSKIFITGYVSCDITASSVMDFKLYNGASEITGATGDTGASTNAVVGRVGDAYGSSGILALPFIFLYESLTTSATTINLYFAGPATTYVNKNHAGGNGYSSQMTLMEIGV
jgi:hypothetical protein